MSLLPGGFPPDGLGQPHLLPLLQSPSFSTWFHSGRVLCLYTAPPHHRAGPHLPPTEEELALQPGLGTVGAEGRPLLLLLQEVD